MLEEEVILFYGSLNGHEGEFALVGFIDGILRIGTLVAFAFLPLLAVLRAHPCVIVSKNVAVVESDLLIHGNIYLIGR